MTRKYTIFKVIIQNSSKGFTLIELIFGLLIMSLIGTLAMNAFIGASNDFNKDKRSIDSSQNLSAILEMIGNDIKESGEKINDPTFPTIEFKLATASDPGLLLGSSKVIIRRAVSDPLTLCQTIATGTAPGSLTALRVADSSIANATPNCAVGTQTSQLQAVRPSANLPNSTYQLTTTAGGAIALPPVAATAVAATAMPILPIPLRKARDYRCTLDEPNPTTPYDAPARASTDFCGGTGEVARIAVSDGKGHILIFKQTAESNTTDASAVKYSITVSTAGLDTITLANNTRNQAAPGGYDRGNPIYLIEERSYTLKTNGDLQLSVNGEAPTTLVKRIANFRVSAKGYTDASNNRIINPTPPVPVADICAGAPSTPTVDNPQYICKLNYNTGAIPAPPATEAMDWKWTAGVRVELQSQYDSTGQSTGSATGSGDIAQRDRDRDKSTAAAEFFPRNVLSK